MKSHFIALLITFALPIAALADVGGKPPPASQNGYEPGTCHACIVDANGKPHCYQIDCTHMPSTAGLCGRRTSLRLNRWCAYKGSQAPQIDPRL